MWFFDAVLEEKPVAANTTAVQSNTASVEDDGSFLIITDTPTTVSDAPAPRESVGEVSIFDATLESSDDAVSSETASAEDIVFFSETSVGSDVTSGVSAGQTVDTPVEAVTDANIVSAPAEVTSTADDLMMSFADDVAPVSFSGSSSSGASAGQDPNTILEKAIAELETLRANHVRLSEEKGKEIEAYNARIAEAKAGAKEALGAQKKIEAEIARVDEMKKLFASQLSK